MGRICKNKITDVLREQFGANPLKVPEARIQPMCILEIQDDTQKYLGQFKYLVKGGFPHDIPQTTEPVAAVSNQKTATIDFNFGLDILGNFLKALGADPAAITAGLNQSRKMAFSFTNVRRTYIDPLMLGSVLSQYDLYADKDNFILQPALTNMNIRLGLITDIIISNNFSLSTYTETDAHASINVPAIAEALSKVNASLKVEKKTDNEVNFEGPADLTFAFTCLEIKIDPVTGKFSRGEWLQNIKSIDGKPPSPDQLTAHNVKEIEKLMLDDNEQYPLLIEL